MLTLTSDNTLVLPGQRSRKAPVCLRRGQLPFDHWVDVGDLDERVSVALAAEGIGERQCPTVGEWAAFCYGGSFIACLTGKYPVPPDPETGEWNTGMEFLVWETLWPIAQEGNARLGQVFVEAVLRLLAPREHYSPPSDPWFASDLAEEWPRRFADDRLRSVSNLRLGILKAGREAMAELPGTVAISVGEVAKHMPTMLEIAIRHIRATYHW